MMMDQLESNSEASEPVYAYKPALMGAPFEFRLTKTALEWSKGRYSDRVPYDRFRRLRLSYRPLTMQSYRFLTEIWPVSGPKLQIASTSARGIVDHERLDPAYCAFVGELHRRIAATGAAQTRFQVGSPAALYWMGIVIFVGASLALVGLVIRALQNGDLAGTALVVGFFALFLWQVGIFFHRNRPGTYRPEAIPDQVMPRVGKSRSPA